MKTKKNIAITDAITDGIPTRDVVTIIANIFGNIEWMLNESYKTKRPVEVVDSECIYDNDAPFETLSGFPMLGWAIKECIENALRSQKTSVDEILRLAPRSPKMPRIGDIVVVHDSGRKFRVAAIDYSKATKSLLLLEGIPNKLKGQKNTPTYHSWPSHCSFLRSPTDKEMLNLIIKGQ